MTGAFGECGMQDLRDLRLVLKPMRHLDRAKLVLAKADAERPQARARRDKHRRG